MSWPTVACGSRGRTPAGRRRVLVLGVHPLQDAAASRRGGPGAREAASSAEVHVGAALAYREFMVSNYSDAGAGAPAGGQGHRPAARHRTTGRAGCGRSQGVPHDAKHIVVATGSDPVVPPVPGLADLEGVWSNREVTGMKAAPRRLVILGAGPVGAEMAQAVRRLGGEVVVVEGAGRVLAHEPEPLGEALGEVLRGDGVELLLGVQATAARRDGEDYVLTLDDGREVRGDHLLVVTGRRPGVDGTGLDTVGVEADRHGIPVDTHLRVADGVWAIGDVTGVRLLTHVGKYQGEVVVANILGEPREADYEAIPDVVTRTPRRRRWVRPKARFAPPPRRPRRPRPRPTPTPTRNRTAF